MTDRVERIERALHDAFSPTHLLVKEQSHLHAGHAGAQDGKGHFEVQIVSDVFSDLSTIKRHRAIYEALGTMMQTDIHALQIKARSTSEAA